MVYITATDNEFLLGLSEDNCIYGIKGVNILDTIKDGETITLGIDGSFVSVPIKREGNMLNILSSNVEVYVSTNLYNVKVIK